ncbi:MAG TPA: LLM class flavin-dependent oxidoreductase, partial [Acidimicrobiales bacterium]|nr:LLM class flavin-dependent oxidoreductase [Acidimicrobiales bacterium]
LFDELSDPHVVVDLSRAAEVRGWDGVFVWDHLRYADPVVDVADPWVVMAAIAAATDRVRIGPMVTPVPRRRPQVLARQTATLDHLSRGRLVFGVGIGGDPGGELRLFGEELDAKARAALLDDGLRRIDAWWSGDEVDGASLLPRPVQRPRIPVWVASRHPHRAPVRRAARWDGWFPIGLDEPEQLAEELQYVATQRTTDAPFDVVVQGLPGVEPAPWFEAGATWWLVRFEPFGAKAAEVRAVIDDGPPET